MVSDPARIRSLNDVTMMDSPWDPNQLEEGSEKAKGEMLISIIKEALFLILQAYVSVFDICQHMFETITEVATRIMC